MRAYLGLKRMAEEALLESLWERVNGARLRGVLKVVPQFRVNPMEGALAYFHPDFPSKGRCLIEFGEASLKFSPGRLLDLMVHEAIHQLQWERDLPMGHNESFAAFADGAGLVEKY